MATEEVIICVTQEDGTVRTKGDPNGLPWLCSHCNGTKVYMPLVYEECECAPCLSMECTGNLLPQQDVRKVSGGSVLPSDSVVRKNTPLARGLLDYFPAALAAVAQLSKAGNDKHNPGEDLHHSRGKSGDHADCIIRHLADRGTVDTEDGFLHDVKVAWRALALLQEALEARGAPMPRAARPAK